MGPAPRPRPAYRNSASDWGPPQNEHAWRQAFGVSHQRGRRRRFRAISSTSKRAKNRRDFLGSNRGRVRAFSMGQRQASGVWSSIATERAPPTSIASDPFTKSRQARGNADYVAVHYVPGSGSDNDLNEGRPVWPAVSACVLLSFGPNRTFEYDTPSSFPPDATSSSTTRPTAPRAGAQDRAQGPGMRPLFASLPGPRDKRDHVSRAVPSAGLRRYSPVHSRTQFRQSHRHHRRLRLNER